LSGSFTSNFFALRPDREHAMRMLLATVAQRAAAKAEPERKPPPPSPDHGPDLSAHR